MARKSGVAGGEITRWLERIKRAERVRDAADRRYGYTRAIQQYQGNYASALPSFVADVDLVPINEVYAYVKTFIPSVYSRDPHITVNPEGLRSVAAAKILELAVNAYWRDLRLKREVRRCIMDAVMAEGWMKVGFTSAFGSVQPEEGKPEMEPSEFIKDEEIFAARVSWKNMVRDPDAVNGLHDARWVAQNIIRPIEAIRASGLYEKTAEIQTAFYALPSEPRELKDIKLMDAVEYGSLWEIWDRDTNRVLTISEGSGVYHMNKEWPYEIDGFGFELLRFNENPDECYAPNLIAAWEPQLWEKMKLRAMELDHLKRFNRQLWIKKGDLSRAEKDKFKLGKTGSIIEGEKQASQPPQAVPYPPIQPDIYAVENRIDLDKDNISGQPNAVRSAPQRTQSRTLGEIEQLVSAFQSRQSDPQGIVEEFAGEVAIKIIGLMKQYLTAPKFVRATQRDVNEIAEALVDPVTGQSRFDGTGFTFTRQDIQDCEFQVDVKSGSTLPMDRQRRMDSMIALLKLGPTLGIQPGGKLSQVLGRNLLAEFEMPEVEAAFEDEINKANVAAVMQRVAQKADLAMTQQKIADTMQQVRGLTQGQPNGGQGGL